jgi:hypothetical protein
MQIEIISKITVVSEEEEERLIKESIRRENESLECKKEWRNLETALSQWKGPWRNISLFDHDKNRKTIPLTVLNHTSKSGIKPIMKIRHQKLHYFSYKDLEQELFLQHKSPAFFERLGSVLPQDARRVLAKDVTMNQHAFLSETNVQNRNAMNLNMNLNLNLNGVENEQIMNLKQKEEGKQIEHLMQQQEQQEQLEEERIQTGRTDISVKTNLPINHTTPGNNHFYVFQFRI